jgi:hypothetical protein
MIETRFGSWRVAIPAQALVQYEFVHGAFDGQAEGRPTEHRAVPEDRITTLDLDSLRVGIPQWPSLHVDDMSPNAFTRRINDQVVVGEQVSLFRLEAGSPVDVWGTVGKIVFWVPA